MRAKSELSDGDNPTNKNLFARDILRSVSKVGEAPRGVRGRSYSGGAFVVGGKIDTRRV